MSETDATNPGDLPAPNITHAGITGKVPQTLIRRPRRRGGKSKAVKLSSDQRRHVKQLTARGQISARAASNHGLQARK